MQNDELVTGRIALQIAGQAIEMEMTVPVKPVKPRRMLPVFQKMTSSFVDLSVKAVEETGGEISCKAGCGACCRQAVPISEVEVYQIAEFVGQLEEPRKSEIKKRFADGTERFRQIGWFERMENCARLTRTGSPEEAQKELESATLEYFYEGVPCPFLENESCSIHEVRPLVCREYLVVSPAENCSRPTAAAIDKVPLLAKPSKSLIAMTRTDVSAALGFVPMIQALEVAENFPENFPEKSGQRWAADLFEHLTKTEIPTEGVGGD